MKSHLVAIVLYKSVWTILTRIRMHIKRVSFYAYTRPTHIRTFYKMQLGLKSSRDMIHTHDPRLHASRHVIHIC